MTTKSSASELTRLINQLRVERQHHLDSITEIDQTFKEFGIVITGGGAKGRGKGKGWAAGKGAAEGLSFAPGEPNPSGPRKGKRGPGRGKGKVKVKVKVAKKTGVPRSPWASKFPITGDQLIIDFVRERGGATTEEIRKHWEGSGRRGKAENNLTNLVKSGKLKRTKVEGKPGSVYSVP